MAEQFKIRGADKALAILQDLPKKMQKKYASRAARKGAAIIQKAAVAKARVFDDPKTPNKIYKEIATRANSRLGRQNGGIALSIGVKGGAMAPYKNSPANKKKGLAGQSYQGPGKVYYWRFKEFGTKKMKAQPFLGPAMSENVEAATDAIVIDLNAGITEAVGSV